MSKILIVDDRPINRQFLTTLLGYQKHELFESSDGAEALEIARKKRPDLIISDVLMPTMDGYEFVRRLRQEPGIEKTPVIFSTAHYLSRESQALAEKCGVTSIIYKPCEPATVLQIVESALKPSRAETSQPAPEEFDRVHIQVLTDQLSYKNEQLRNANEKLTALIELSTELSQERDPNELIDRYCSVVREIIGARWSLAVLLDRTRERVDYFFATGIELNDTPELRASLISSGIFSTLMKEGQAISLSDVTSRPGSLRLPPELPRADSLLATPLKIRGDVYGWICLGGKLGLDAFSEQDERLMSALAAKMAVAYQNALLLEQTQQQVEQLEQEIGARAAVEAERAQTQAQLASVIGSAMDAIVAVDESQQVLIFNAAAEKMFGYTAEEAIGQSLDRFIPKTSHDAHRQHIRSFAETHVTTRTMGALGSVSGINRLNKEFPIEASISQVEVGGKKLFTAILRDITARKEAEEALHELNETLRTFIHASPLAIVALDLERNVKLWNPAAERLFGWKEAEALGRRLPTIADEDLSEHLELREYFLDRALPISDFETRRRRKDGSVVDVSVSFAPLRDAHGKINGTMGIIADITERKNAEKERLKAAQEYKLLFEGNPAPMWVFDRDDLRFLAVNKAAIAHYGYTREEFLRMTVRDIRPDEEIARFDEAVSHPFKGLGSSGIWKHKKKDGAVIHIEVNAGSLEFDGRSAELVLVKDVTEQLQAQEAVRQKTAELTGMTQQLWQASKLATMGELAASVAHELNNPLATVALRAENMLMQMPEDSSDRRSLQIILDEVDRMAKLVNNLLQFSRRSHRQISTVDVREELANSVEFIQYHLRSHKIEITRNFAEALPNIHADRQQLRQLFLNLLTNASDAMAEGGKLTITVKCTYLMDASAVQIDFADNGEGISAENLAKIWEPFFTTKAEGKGTGLGLAICRRIVEEHGGTIDIESQIDRGTTVKIILPAASDKDRAN